MRTVDLYVYYNEDGSVTVTPTAREKSDKPGKTRLIADEGHILTNGTKRVRVIDTDSPDEWTEEQARPEDIRQRPQRPQRPERSR